MASTEQQQRRQSHADPHCDSPGTSPAYTGRKPVREPAANRGKQRHRQERCRSPNRCSHQIQAADLDRIKVEPVVIHIKRVTLKPVPQDQSPHRDTRQHSQPGYASRGGPGSSRYIATRSSWVNELEFCRVDTLVFLRPVPRIGLPDGNGQKGQASATVEGGSPTLVHHGPSDKNGRQCPANPQPAGLQATRKTSLFWTRPRGDHPGHIRRHRRFANSSKKANSAERQQHTDSTAYGQRGGKTHRQGPKPEAQYRNRQCPPGSDAVAYVSPRDLKQRIAPKKGAENASHRERIESELFFDAFPGYAQVQPVQCGHRHNGHNDGKNVPPNARSTSIGSGDDFACSRAVRQLGHVFQKNPQAISESDFTAIMFLAQQSVD